MNLTKDTYEYILNFADDREILNMLSVNKKFRDEKLFEKILKKRYPDLLQYKGEESFSSFFIKMVYYIVYLKEKYDIPYFVGMNPEELYNSSKMYIRLAFYRMVMTIAAKFGNLEVVKLMVNKGVETFDDARQQAVENGHLEILKYLISLGGHDFHDIARWAVYAHHKNIIDYLFENKYISNRYLNNLLVYTAENGDLDLVKHLIFLGATNFPIAIDYARMTGQEEVVNYLQTLL